MKVYVVYCARRVGDIVVGVYTDEDLARKIAVLSYGEYDEFELDSIPVGVKNAAPKFGMTL